MNIAQRRAYNAKKQKEYRDKERGKPARHYIKLSQLEEIMKAAGHCGFCGMLLESEYHKMHPLVGCIDAGRRASQ